MSVVKDIETAEAVARRVKDAGGRCFYVGGFVRDRLLGRENKDVDIEVHGLSPAELETILDFLGERLTVGESFGIYTLKGCSLDISLPRREGFSGGGHTELAEVTDPFIGPKAAAGRRDFTLNAMMQDVLTGEILDFFDGQADLERGIIRHVTPTIFREDPLRVLRAAQFAARFGFTVAGETLSLCRGVDLYSLPKERVEGEVKKALLKSERPSVFFELLREMGQLDTWFPELKALIGVEQNPEFHSEGDVWNHTMLVLDRAAECRDKARNPFAFMLSALTHDMGKALCTEEIDGVIHAYEHELLGLAPARAFVKRLTDENDVLKTVLNQTELHMRPNVMAAARSSVKKTNHLFDEAVDPEALIALAICDGLGTVSSAAYVSHEAFFESRLAAYREYMSRPYVMGRDLLEAGLTPGESFGDYLAYAHKLRLAGVPKESALKQTLAFARKKERSPGKSKP